MTSNVYRFDAEIEGISLGAKLELATLSPLLRNISIKQAAVGHLQVEVRKSLTAPPEIALTEATAEVDELLDRLSLIDNHRVLSITYLGFTDASNQFHKPRTRGGASATLGGHISDPLAYYDHPTQRLALAGRVNPGLTRLLRVSQGMPDGIGKFLLLYGAVQVLAGETQATVDAFLLSLRPDTLVVQGKRRPETVITHLRNLIAHPENDIDVGNLAGQAAMYCHSLSAVVRSELVRTAEPPVI